MVYNSKEKKEKGEKKLMLYLICTKTILDFENNTKNIRETEIDSNSK